jgi:hypothetical protein
MMGPGQDRGKKGRTVGNARSHVGVEVGDGLVARFGEAVVLVAEPDRYPAGTEQLLHAVELAASGAGSPGAEIAGHLAGMVVAQPSGFVPPFGVVAPLDDAYVVLLFGAVSADIAAQDGIERLSGLQAVTWLDRRIDGLVDHLSIGTGHHPVRVDPRSDLRAGLVPGSGFVMTLAPAPAPAPVVAAELEPVAAEPEPEPVAAIEPEPELVVEPQPVLAEAEPVAAEPEPEPVVAAEAEPVAAIEPEPELVVEPQPVLAEAEPVAAEPEPEPVVAAEPEREPVAPEQGAGYAWPDQSEASATAARSARATEVVTAPVGWLVASDGTRLPLDRPYVLGREPENDPAVMSGAATPVRLADEESLISRVQSYVYFDGGQVWLQDASSANGTYIAAPGAPAWTRVGTGAVALPPTWSVRVGNLVFTHVAAATSPS